jgi:hypothetical protein
VTEGRVRGDFNGVFVDEDVPAGNVQLLCLSHTKDVVDESGALVQLRPGMILTAFEPDIDENDLPDNLLATGVVEPAPSWLSCRGSQWVLRLDSRGVRHESDDRSRA